MEDQPSEGKLPESSSGARDEEIHSGPPVADAPGEPATQALAMEAEEIRRLVAAGADSPEAIRELAARLRDHRAREEALWRVQVKPALVKEGKGRFRSVGSSLPPATTEPASSSNSLMLGLVLLGMVAAVLVAASTSVWVLLLPLVALLVWAWYQGRDSTR